MPYARGVTGHSIWKLVTFCYDLFWRRGRPEKLGPGAEKPSANSMNWRNLVLAILAAADGRPYTPVQIQKAVFVICDQIPELIDEGPGFQFEPYDYGPFDSNVYSAIDRLEDAGLAEIAPSAYGNWNTYAASDEGIEKGEKLLDEMNADDEQYIRKISGWVRSLSFTKLVKSIYEAYPHMRANSIFKG